MNNFKITLRIENMDLDFIGGTYPLLEFKDTVEIEDACKLFGNLCSIIIKETK